MRARRPRQAHLRARQQRRLPGRVHDRPGVYEAVVYELFDTLDELHTRLSSRRFLLGDAPVEIDWRHFTTLVRFDPVYAVHFKCSLRRLVEYPNLWPYTRDLYQEPGIADTVRLDEIRGRCYRTHAGINPSGLVAVPPAADLTVPAGREALGGA